MGGGSPAARLCPSTSRSVTLLSSPTSTLSVKMPDTSPAVPSRGERSATAMLPIRRLAALDGLENSGSRFGVSSTVRSYAGTIETGEGCFQGNARYSQVLGHRLATAEIRLYKSAIYRRAAVTQRIVPALSNSGHCKRRSISTSESVRIVEVSVRQTE